ncbi:hypothetical protein [Desulfopila inferna]|uniref:hypothetical protein n=1 Tax=Desulfopila inferna TaxID=468528 RepID=UPI001963F09B|nr:hypothetical protein [Desulfopila inferna]MBM9604145.1 hypothetical protein [Desulfopila inferna]
MKGENYIQQPLLNAISANIQKSGKAPSLSTALDVEFNDIAFHFRAHEGKAILTFENWSNALDFFREMKKLASTAPDTINDIRHFLHAIGLTIYLQNRKFGIIGPQAGYFIPGLLSISTLSSRR